MPDEPGRFSARRGVWVATAAVVVLVAVVALAVGLASAPGGTSTGTTTPVITASVSAVGPVAPPAGPLAPRLRPVAAPASCSNAARVLRVLQFNIHFGVSRNGGLGLTALADEITAVRPDLVSLNEVDSRTFRSRRIDEAAYLAQATGLHGVYGPNLPWEGGLFGNAILSRHPVVATSNVHLPRAPGLERRGLLTATVRIGDRTVAFSSMHLSDGPDGRVSRTLEARTVAAVLSHAAYPTVVAGDLNARPRCSPAADPPPAPPRRPAARRHR